MTSELLSIKVLSPTRPILEVSARSVILPAKDGYVQILPNHASYITEMQVGDIVIDTGKTEDFSRYFVCGGYAHIENNSVHILADVVEKASEIDKSRAEASKKRAQERLSSSDPSIDMDRALSSLKRAEIRLLTIKSSKT